MLEQFASSAMNLHERKEQYSADMMTGIFVVRERYGTVSGYIL